MLITEIFHSIQGEGPFTGIPMIFIRTSLCNLRCKWCDTTYSFEGGTEMEVDVLIKIVEDSWEEWVCLTGGEPLLQKEAPDLVRRITSAGKRVLIETGGSLSIEPYTMIEKTVIDMDVKTPSSGEEKRLRTENLNLLRKEDYAKFVISDDTDFAYLENFYAKYGKLVNIVVQPSYGTPEAWIAERIIEKKMLVRFMLQEHKYIWGQKRGV
ncbi:MAG: radical SAM protein [Candidatus Thermoplasmatota archaeon]|jgi:7-carboxy-7-deazaguanine synthase|nr:radical SAM protein [Candidatus Thermoplasmatota archaeon]MCL5790466.1 radical SAM protein [Candidatus Thermoplasmatota archaeon]